MELFLNKHTIIWPIFFNNLDFSISNFSLSVVLAPLFFALIIKNFVKFEASSTIIIPDKMSFLFEMIYSTFYNSFYEYLGSKGEKYINFLMSLMFFIFILNFCNLIPGFFPCTSQIALTGSLSFMIFILLLGIGLYEYKLKIWNHFIPQNVPLILKPLLFIIELITFLMRPISLALRLTISILSGHVILHVLSSFANANYFSIKLLTFLFTTFLTLFEIGICFLQAYIFITLSCVFISEILNSHH